MTGWIAVIVVGLVAGWLAGLIMKNSSGLLEQLAVGVIGSVIGSYFLGTMFGPGLVGSILTATVGAVILLFVVGLIRRAMSK